MNDNELFREIERIYDQLTPRMKKAARYVAKNPVSIALYPLRQVASEANVSTTTFVRLAATLKFSGYGAFRDALRAHVKGSDAYAKDADNKIAGYQSSGFEKTYLDSAHQQINAISLFFNRDLMHRLIRAGNILHGSDRIYVIGARSMHCLSFYFNYLVGTFDSRVTMLDDSHGMLSDKVFPIKVGDSLLAFSFEPYARTTIQAMEYAHGCGASIVAVTDSMLSPLANLSLEVIIAPTEGPSFYQSLAPSIMVVEALSAHLLSRTGAEASERIRARFQARENFGDYWIGARSKLK